MVAFGFGTLPAMAAASLAAGGLAETMRRAGARRAAGAVLVAFGLLALWGGLGGFHAGHGMGGAEVHGDAAHHVAPHQG